MAAAIKDPAADLHAPALCDVELAAALARFLRAGLLSPERAAEALRDYLDLPLARHGHEALLARIVSLGRNLSVYDATYVALAERLGAGLVTLDGQLARAVTAHSWIPVLPA